MDENKQKTLLIVLIAVAVIVLAADVWIWSAAFAEVREASSILQSAVDAASSLKVS